MSETPSRHETQASHHPHGTAPLATLALAALGVVYGDIGTSPLYALQDCVHSEHGVRLVENGLVAPQAGALVLGLLSLFFWSVTLVVAVKYLTFIMRADNGGEGGVLALLALIPEDKSERAMKQRRAGRIGGLAALVVFGACLLYGDGIITPAISVLSAVEGLKVATTSLTSAVIPITVLILVLLFWVQKRGTATIGRVFGPIMVTWFATLAVLGLIGIVKHPTVFSALNPMYAVAFLRDNGFHGFRVLGSVVLCITGGEALYADMGHFGRKPIQTAWYGMVMPSLILCYFGQGALLLEAATHGPERLESVASNPFYSMVPAGPLIYPLVVLSASATVIASQALISGAYSLTHQAVQLGYLPRVTVTHTSSETEGQIYIPEVNGMLMVGCVGLVFAFKESANLAAAYGIAVTGTMAITSIAFFVVVTRRWGWSLGKALPLLVFFLGLDLSFFGANLLKFFDGGFVPIFMAVGIYFIMHVWKRGRGLLGQYFVNASKPLDKFLDGIERGIYTSSKGVDNKVIRVPGVAVFLTSNPNGTPPVLMHHSQHNKAVQETVLLVTVSHERVPRVLSERVTVSPLRCGFYRVNIRNGYMETPNVPKGIDEAIRAFDLPFQLDDVTYYLGRETLLATTKGEMGPRAESLFAFLTRNSQTASRYFGIPAERVVEIGMQIDL